MRIFFPDTLQLRKVMRMIDFGKRLKALRQKRDITQLQLANSLGVTKSVISAYETGLRYPGYDILIKIARHFSVSTDYLLGLSARREIDLSGLTDKQISALIALINTMRE